MGLTDFVSSSVSISNTSVPTVQGLSTGLIAAYHNVYPDRVRLYSTATALSQMVTDGFSVNSAAYKAASAYCSALGTPPLLAIGRRSNMPRQSLQLACVDATVGDAYLVTLVGSTGVTSSVGYTNVINYGAAVAGKTVALTASATITFSGAVTMAAGDALTFASQPGVVYFLASAIVATTAGTLTVAYSGTAAPTATATHIATTADTFDTIANSPTAVVSGGGTPFTVGQSLMFASQPGVVYVCASCTASLLTLTQNYTGAGAASDTAVLVCTQATAAAALATAINALTITGSSVAASIGTVAASGANVTISRIDGNLTDVQNWTSNGFSSLQLTDLTADPGITADLTAIKAANPGAWFGLILDSNSSAEILSAAAWTEATGQTGQVFFANNSDAINGQASGDTSSVFYELHQLGYTRTLAQNNSTQLLNYGGASICAYMLSQNPGSTVAAYKSQPGVPADSPITLPEANALAINSMTATNPGPGGKFGNYYKTTAGQNWLWPGCVPSGQWMDIIIGATAVNLAVQQAVASVLAGLPKVPFDDFGLGLIGTAIEAVLRLFSTSQYNFILPDGQDPARPISVLIPKASSLTSAQRASRDVTGFAWSAGLQGAALNAKIAGTLLP